MVNQDLRDWSLPKQSQYDLVLSINVVPYIEDLDQFFYACSSRVTLGGKVLVAAPVRSVVWEDEFDNVRVLFHKPEDVTKAAELAGFKSVDRRWIGFRVPISHQPIIIGFVELFSL